MNTIELRRNLLPLLFLCASALASAASAAATTRPSPTVTTVFTEAAIRWSPDSLRFLARRGLSYADGGRTVATTVTLPSIRGPHRITALLTVRPVPKTEREVCDRYDRAGSIRMAIPGSPDLEVLRFITAYGGETHHEVDVTALIFPWSIR